MKNEWDNQMNELQSALRKQKNSSLPTPPDGAGLDQLYNYTQNFFEAVTRVVISVINGTFESDMVPDGDELQRKLDEVRSVDPTQVTFMTRIQKWKQEQDDLLELALRVIEEPPNTQEPFREVYQAQGQLDANIMLAFLKANGVDAFSSQESAGVTYGLTIGPLGLARIYVPTEQYDEATDLIRQMDNDQLVDDSDPTNETFTDED